MGFFHVHIADLLLLEEGKGGEGKGLPYLSSP